MTLETLRDEISEITDGNDTIFSYFISYMEAGNIRHNIRGEYRCFDSAIEEVKGSSLYLGSTLPIVQIVFYCPLCAHSYVLDEEWDELYGEQSESHIHANVPYLDEDGRFYELPLKDRKNE